MNVNMNSHTHNTHQLTQIAALEEALLVSHSPSSSLPDPPSMSSNDDDDTAAPPPAIAATPPVTTTLHLEPTPLAAEVQPQPQQSSTTTPQEGPTWADVGPTVVPAMVAAPVVARSGAPQQGVPAARTMDGVEMGVLRSGTSWASRTGPGGGAALRQRRGPGGTPQGSLVMRRHGGGVKAVTLRIR